MIGGLVSTLDIELARPSGAELLERTRSLASERPA